MKIRKAVITAAGKGTRQYPATHAIQKELLPLVDRDGHTKPTIQIIIEEALESGIEEIGVVTAPEDEAVFRNYFRAMDADMRERFAAKPWGLEISDRLAGIGRRLSTIVQPTQEGYGHAVWCAKDWVGDDPFLLLLGDHVYISREARTTMRQVMDAAERFRQTVFAVQRTPESRVHLYGTVEAEQMPDDPNMYRILSMREKPSADYARRNLRAEGLDDDEFLCFFGMHALRPEIFECLDELVTNDIRDKGEIQFTSAQGMYARRYPAIAFEVNGDRYDMGVPLGLVETQIALSLRGVFEHEIRAFWNSMPASVAV
jgi:UTP--glucose-1-phosphate uridylyltransferase